MSLSELRQFPPKLKNLRSKKNKERTGNHIVYMSKNNIEYYTKSTNLTLILFDGTMFIITSLKIKKELSLLCN